MARFLRFIRWAGIALSFPGIIINQVLNAVGIWQLAQNTIWIWTAIGLGVFFICVISLAYSQQKRLEKLEHAKSDTSNPDSNASTKSKSIEVQPLIARMPNEQEKRGAWYSSISSDDEQQISNRVYVVARKMHLAKLNYDNPVSEFDLKIINATIFQIIIGKVGEGRIIYENEEQNFDPVIDTLTLGHGENGFLQLSQRLFPNVAKSIQDKIDASKNIGADITFQFHRLRIVINVILPDGTPLNTKQVLYLKIEPSDITEHFTNLNLLK